MKRKLLITLALTICFSGVASAAYEPVRAIIAPASHQDATNEEQSIGKHNQDTVNGAVEKAAGKSTDGSLEPDPVNAASKQQHRQQQRTSATRSATPKPSNVPKSTNTTQPITQPTQPNLSTPVHINIAAQLQGPELYNGCEVTSLSMLLSAAGQPVDKMTLANRIAKDSTPAVYDSNKKIISWGDPNRGFVGDVTGTNPGYGVYHGPVTQLLNSILPGRALDLTGSSFDQVLTKVALGKPVIAWTTATFTPTANWTTWQGPNGPVRATFDEHVVLIVGFTASQVLLNDPLDGTASKAVDRQQFLAAWQQLGNQAVSYVN